MKRHKKSDEQRRAVVDEWLALRKKEYKYIFNADGEPTHAVATLGEGMHAVVTLSDFDRMVIKRRCLDNEQRNNFKENYLLMCIANGDTITFDEDSSKKTQESSEGVVSS